MKFKMNLFRSILESIGLLERTRLVDRLNTNQLEKLEDLAREEKSKILISMLNRYERINSEEIQLIAELGSFLKRKDKMEKLYKALNDKNFNNLQFDIQGKFDPEEDYVEVYYLEMVDGRRFIFLHINRYDFGIEPRIEDIFEIDKNYPINSSGYNRIMFQRN